MCPEKDDPNCTGITIGGNCICYPGNVGTNTASLQLVKPKGARFSSINLKNFYLDIPMHDPEYIGIKIPDFQRNSLRGTSLPAGTMMGGITSKSAKGVMDFPKHSSFPMICFEPTLF